MSDPKGIRIGGGWLLDATTGVARKDPTHGMHTPVRHRGCGHLFDLSGAHTEKAVECPGCHKAAEVRDLERL